MDPFDFGGYATKHDLKCSDGLTIRQGAFDEQDGAKVPLIYQHDHSDPAMILGHATLEKRDDGVYAKCRFNKTEKAEHMRHSLQNGDVDSLSIWAKILQRRGDDILHGLIREVSLVLAGANPGARVDYVAHSDDPFDDMEPDLIIHSGIKLDIEHADDEEDDDDETIADVIDTMNEAQRDVLEYLVGQALNNSGASEEDAEHSEKEENDMPNIFESADLGDKNTIKHNLTPAQVSEIFADAAKNGSLKESVLSHAATYGIENIEWLFPDVTELNKTPAFIKEPQEWVAEVMKANATPFSRVRTTFADITADEARARGYVKGNLKKEEVFKLLRRETTPKTIYKKQKLDHDDINDITSFDVVLWIKMEMDLKLREEIARAILISDGREPDDPDKINEDNIRPIWKDAEMYTLRVVADPAWADDPDGLIDSVVEGMEKYEGSGTPVLFTNRSTITKLRLIKDADGHRLYRNDGEIADALGVSKIVPVPFINDKAIREEGASKYQLLGIVVNMKDYNLGTNGGAKVEFFEDFDIDYNQHKYLKETRMSGALVQYRSAMAIEVLVP